MTSVSLASSINSVQTVNSITSVRTQSGINTVQIDQIAVMQEYLFITPNMPEPMYVEVIAPNK